MHANSTCQLLTIGGDDDDKRRPSTVSDTDALGDSPGNKIPESVLQNANRRRMVKHEEAVPHIFLYTDSPIDIDENGLFTFSPGPRTNLNGETAGCTGLLIPLGYLETGYTMLNLVSSNFVCQPEQLKEACCTWG
ncbi:hypothetical protein SARC_15654 [Sphaeroforma arctica JP610]|uniref:Uncharacterized protein n=1 Tax=Sphaeroforma arctica JP610 TaxID=667725 RepID=A0A0L0F5F0_9EUKA|nr:hypothetical protein SARC_15654 [Sphaeroforma arctica JP610]KNC71801.1 hypothetical protein SARC_15654 [Sphaeroforma arctica JP610]|eukprot:XP_014145703.1 hypothetical protein SARC_15654 [Sphaeroforma arctica JP610]